ncbi:hypothetical protein Tco_0260495 [Tanacetum coccineum]
MSESEIGEMVPELSRAVVLAKFDMHIYTSELTPEELEEAIKEYGIPLDLHPQLPPPDLTMDKLPFAFIGIYVEQIEQGGLRIPFSTFFLAVIRHFGVHVSQLIPMGAHRVIMFEIRCRSLAVNVSVPLFRVFYKLCKQGHWFSFKNKVEGRARKCFKERHADSDLRDDFPTNYQERDAARLSAVIVPLRPPPLITMDDFLSLPEWTRVVVSWGQPITEEQRPKKHVTEPLKIGEPIPELSPRQKNLEKSDPKVVAAREKSEQKSLAKAQAKRGGGVLDAVAKKKRARKDLEPQGSRSVGTHLSATPSHSVAPAAAVDTTNVVENVDVTIANVIDGAPVFTEPPRRVSVAAGVGKKLVTYLTRPRWARFPIALCVLRWMGVLEGIRRRQISLMGLRDDLWICTYRDCKELITHLATPAEDEFLRSLSNVDVVRRAYESLGRCVLSQGELLKPNADLSKEFSLLSSAHSSCVDKERVLLDRLKKVETKRDDWRRTASEQVERIKGLEVSSEAQGKLLETAEERVRFLEGENVKLAAGMAKEEMSIAAPVSLCFTAGWLGGLSLGRTPDQIEELIAQSDNLDVEGSKTWKAKHRELFTKSYPFIQKVFDSYRLPFESLMKLIPDASSSAPVDETATPASDGASDRAVVGGSVPET